MFDKASYMREYKKQARARYREQGKCKCGDATRPNRNTCAKCAAYNTEYVKLRRKRLNAEGRCITCGRQKKDDTLECAYCKGNASKKRLEVKKEVFTRYGGAACRCCGESNIFFLSMDHVEGNGADHRRTGRVGNNIYSWLKRNNYPRGFQVLCHNCNHGRYLNGGACPHGKT